MGTKYTDQDIMETYADGWRDALTNLGIDAQDVDAPTPIILDAGIVPF